MSQPLNVFIVPVIISWKVGFVFMNVLIRVRSVTLWRNKYVKFVLLGICLPTTCASQISLVTKTIFARLAHPIMLLWTMYVKFVQQTTINARNVLQRTSPSA